MIRDNVFTLPVCYTVADIHCIILYICTRLGFISGVLICIHSPSVFLSICILCV